MGTSKAGWTADQVDYLCDGTADDVEINAAIQALPAAGGEVVILDGTYNLTGSILVNKNNVTLSGNGRSTILKRAFYGGYSKPSLIYVTSSNKTIQFLSLDGVNSSYAGPTSDNIYLYRSSTNTIIGNTCNDGTSGILLNSNSENNTVIGNSCIRGTGTASDYTSYQYTIKVDNSNNNLIAGNNIMGKNYVDFGTGNTFANNKY